MLSSIKNQLYYILYYTIFNLYYFSYLAFFFKSGFGLPHIPKSPSRQKHFKIDFLSHYTDRPTLAHILYQFFLVVVTKQRPPHNTG